LGVLALLAPPMLLSGCGGGNGGGPQVPSSTGTFLSTDPLSPTRSGTIILQTFSDNSLVGKLTVSAIVAAIGPRAVDLPVGTYNFTGTRTGNTFTATGHFNGTPAFDFTITGTLTATGSVGTYQISGTINGEAFTFSGALQSGGFVATFSDATGANANLTRFFVEQAAGQFAKEIGGSRRTLQIEAPADTTSKRIILISTFKEGAFKVGDTFNLNKFSEGSIVVYRSLITGSSTDQGAWTSHDGELRIDAINGNKVTVSIINARMEGDRPEGGFGTGEFFLNAAGVVDLDFPMS
jgi:hypothetical protein